MSKIIGVTVGTPISPKAVERKLNPVKTVNGIEPDENGNVNVEGNDGITPHIGDNGNWWIGDEDTGVKAEGEKGETGPQGEPGVYILSNGESVADAPADADVVIDPNGDGEQAVLSVNGVKPDASGNVNVEGSGGTEPTGAEKIVEYTADADGASAASFTFTVSDYPKLAQYNHLRGIVKKNANGNIPWVNVILNDTKTQTFQGPNLIGATGPGNLGMFGFEITKNGSYFMGGLTTLTNISLYPGFTSNAFYAVTQKRFTPLYLSELQYIVIASYTAFLDEGATIEIWGWND